MRTHNTFAVAWKFEELEYLKTIFWTTSKNNPTGAVPVANIVVIYRKLRKV